MPEKSPLLSLRARGEWAIFTRPEFKTERVSYAVMTPSAARGVLEAVLWKPAIRWRVERIRVLKPIRFVNIRRNEVNDRAATPSATLVGDGGAPPVLFADTSRAQRNTVALRDVDYVIEARFELTTRAGPVDNVPKFVDMFSRRVQKGQHFHQPYLGCRECVADVGPAVGADPPVGDNRDLGIMLWDVDFAERANRPRFFAARLVEGVLHVPDVPESTLAVGAKEGTR
jgi:CRISPR-associated protein Cas5d